MESSATRQCQCVSQTGRGRRDVRVKMSAVAWDIFWVMSHPLPMRFGEERDANGNEGVCNELGFFAFDL